MMTEPAHLAAVLIPTPAWLSRAISASPLCFNCDLDTTKIGPEVAELPIAVSWWVPDSLTGYPLRVIGFIQIEPMQSDQLGMRSGRIIAGVLQTAALLLPDGAMSRWPRF